MNELFNVYPTRVRAHQTDLNGAMYHGAYFDIFDDARIETFRHLGYDFARMQTTGLRPVIHRVECQYFAPALMDERLTVTVTVERMRPATLRLRYACRRGAQLLALGHATFAFVDANGKPGRVPQDLRELIAATPALHAAEP